MTDIRKESLGSFVKSIILEDKIMLLPLNGDASFRRYFRVENHPLIAVDAPPATQKNREFIAIDEALQKQGVRVPKIIASNLEEGFMLLEDLGNTTFDKVAAGERMQSYYDRAVDLLPGIAACSKNVELPPFDEKFMRFELSIFTEWMLSKWLKVEPDEDEAQIIEESFDYLVKTIATIPYAAMHRDYHSRNLMETEDGTLAVIDFQDMVKGPLTYDLASLVYDCYINLDDKLIERELKRGYEGFVKAGLLGAMDYKEFKHLLRLTSLQRHIKVLGIFCRLSLRDGKDGYLKDLPRVINYVLSECGEDPHFSKLRGIVEKYVVGKF